MLDAVCGYDVNGVPTNDPVKINESQMMMPMALWKGSALSIMIDLMAASLSLGRASHVIGTAAGGEKGVSQVFICINPAAVIDPDAMDAQIEDTVAYLSSLEPMQGMGGVHAPGENLERTRAHNLENGIPVTEETWVKITAAAQI